MTRILELLDREFKITMIDILRVLKEKVGGMREQMGNVSRDMETLRKSKGNARSKKHSNK